jgi:hypothetical protein
LGLGDIGDSGGVFERERFDCGGQRVGILRRRFDTVTKDFTDQVSERGVVGPRPRRQMLRRQACGLGMTRIEYPDLGPSGQVPDCTPRIG